MGGKCARSHITPQQVMEQQNPENPGEHQGTMDGSEVTRKCSLTTIIDQPCVNHARQKSVPAFSQRWHKYHNRGWWWWWWGWWGVGVVESGRGVD